MVDAKTQIETEPTLERELSEEALMTVVGGLAGRGNNDLFPENYIKTEVGTGTGTGTGFSGGGTIGYDFGNLLPQGLEFNLDID